MRLCGSEIPHGEHTWDLEVCPPIRMRCPGRDTGDTTGLNAVPCGRTDPHASHLWTKSGTPWEVLRCFGAMGPETSKEIYNADAGL